MEDLNESIKLFFVEQDRQAFVVEHQGSQDWILDLKAVRFNVGGKVFVVDASGWDLQGERIQIMDLAFITVVGRTGTAYNTAQSARKDPLSSRRLNLSRLPL